MLYNHSKFRIANGVIYGNEVSSTLRNISSGSEGAALYREGTNVITEYGTFAIPKDPASEWTSNGVLTTSDKTIRVVNGVLQE